MIDIEPTHSDMKPSFSTDYTAVPSITGVPDIFHLEIESSRFKGGVSVELSNGYTIHAKAHKFTNLFSSSSPFMEIYLDDKKTVLYRVYQKVIENTTLVYSVEINKELSEGGDLSRLSTSPNLIQSHMMMYNKGLTKTTKVEVDSISMFWYGTTGLASTFGSSYFELREEAGTQPVIAKYHKTVANPFSLKRTVGKMAIATSARGYELAVVVMALVLRETENRKNIEPTATMATSPILLPN